MGKLTGVEGDWKNLTIRIATTNDIKSLKKHLRENFYQDEPLCKCAGYSEDFGADFDKIWTAFIEHQLTLIAIDRDINKVAGVRITFNHTKNFDLSNKNWSSNQMRIILYFLGELDKQACIFETFKVENYAEFFLVSVDRAYRNKGLTGEMYRRSILLLKAKEFQLVKCVFTNSYSRQAGKKIGFQELARMDFLDGLKEDGQKWLPNAQTGQAITLEILLL